MKPSALPEGSMVGGSTTFDKFYEVLNHSHVALEENDVSALPR